MTKTRGQQSPAQFFNLGDPAPPLRVKEWIKGTPVKTFERRNVYVVEFWATWCRPCIAAMPHLSKLASKYKGQVTFLAIDVYETKTTSMEHIKAFVNGMGRRMKLNVAVEDTNFTVHDWLDAWDEKDNGIPRTFVVNLEGNVAWIGHPKDLDTVLRKMMNGTWDIKKALSKRIFNNHLQNLDMEVIDKVRRYQGRYDHLEDLGKPDSTLFAIDKMIKKDPNLKYAPWVASYTFSALLRTDPHKAYEFGKETMATSTYDDPACDRIIDEIKDDSRKVAIPPEIYELGAECYQAVIDRLPYPELVDLPKKYREMAAWYILAGDKPKAIKAERKALKLYRKSSRQ